MLVDKKGSDLARKKEGVGKFHHLVQAGATWARKNLTLRVNVVSLMDMRHVT